jgi:hypothetical protein
MLLIPPPLAQSIADYLVTCPYKEVARLIEQMSQLRPAPESAPAPTVVASAPPATAMLTAEA